MFAALCGMNLPEIADSFPETTPSAYSVLSPRVSPTNELPQRHEASSATACLAPNGVVTIPLSKQPSRSATAFERDSPLQPKSEDGTDAALPKPVRAHRRPALTRNSEVGMADLPRKAVPLPEAETRAARIFSEQRWGRMQTGPQQVCFFNPEVVLVKFRMHAHVAALRVEPDREWPTVELLKKRSDVEFAEMDVLQQRQFVPNDAQVTNQWHHSLVGSFEAWQRSLGQPFLRVAIVDAPFQMDHPDLAANTANGWDVVNGVPVTAGSGITHATLCAGMVSAVINNDIGVAGAGNCQILPINIDGATSEMYQAIIWAADHGVRVVNISWTGGASDTLNAAGEYLKTKGRGILAMAGVNGSGFLDYTNQPNIYCISMTDAEDNLRSHFGLHIDFAAPGWEILSTSIGSSYINGSGTSFSTPLFCGIVAVLLSINPTLDPDQVIEIVRQTAVDLGPLGWDQYFGWGRINFAAAAEAAAGTLPTISAIVKTNGQVTVTTPLKPGLDYSLWKTTQLSPLSWMVLTNAILSTNGSKLVLTDPDANSNDSFYRIHIVRP